MAHQLMIGETAKLIGVCTQRVRQLEAEGRLTARRIGRGFRIFDAAEVARFLEERAARKKRKK